ncbi:MAG: polysaccharide biosynthesis protein [Gemmatimonadaceae bacterium]|nr:polysaccharide biosynthesis protein [Gemmatimonadaceae bacterium]NUR20313.1 polysaccharide biosynthesis protein [Gemmatimonadaceae bacterium]
MTHAAIIAIAYATAYGLRFDFRIPATEARLALQTLPWLLGIRLILLGQLSVYRGSWRHVGSSDLASLALATSTSTVLFVGALFAVGKLAGMPRSVLVIDWLLFIFLAGGMRFAARWVRETPFVRRGGHGRRTLVIGAGQAAERFLRQGLHDRRTGMTFIGLLDDDEKTHGLSLHGVPVLGGVDALQRVATRRNAELLVIAIPSATGEQIRRIVGICTSTGLDFKILPPLDELLDGRAHVGQVRDVRIEDLLGRDPIHLDLDRVERDLARKTVLVTGGAGSIGSELARQIAGFCPSRLILFEQAESPLYFVHLELSRTYPGLEIVPVIGDVTDGARVESVFTTYRPDYVFHAAAYKHVPMMEANVVEAVRNNVMGTLRVAECAARHGAQKFVLISTDKAVNPSSVMGTTKRLAELIVLGHPVLRASRTDFRAVRFGNVLGSDGSVIPLFKRQIAAGGPVTVTDPKARRYFMSIPEAVQLVLQAAALPEAARRITMLDMGEPVAIVDLAEQLIRLSGLVPYRDVHIVFTGLRPGEKLDEELTSQIEASIPTAVEKIHIVETGRLEPRELEAGLGRLRDGIMLGEEAALVRTLRALVPEYRPKFVEQEVGVGWRSELEQQSDRPRPVAATFRTPFELGSMLAGSRESQRISPLQ